MKLLSSHSGQRVKIRVRDTLLVGLALGRAATDRLNKEQRG